MWKSHLNIVTAVSYTHLLLVDEKGQVLDGDQIMLLCALKLKEEGKLKGDTIVGTVMSNIGCLLYTSFTGLY